MFNVVKGDLVEMAKRGEVSALVHGCNCLHAMLSGIAGQISREFPVAVDADNKTPKNNYNKLGTLSVAKAGALYIINAYTQFYPGPDAREDAIMMCLDKSIYFCKKIGLDHLGMPEIGCGLGGLDRDLLIPKFEAIGNSTDIKLTLVEFEKETK